MQYTQKHLEQVLSLFEGKEPEGYTKEQFLGYSFLVKIKGRNSIQLTLGMSSKNPIKTRPVEVDFETGIKAQRVLRFFVDKRLNAEKEKKKSEIQSLDFSDWKTDEKTKADEAAEDAFGTSV